MKNARVLGIITAVAGIVLIVAGGIAYLTIRHELKAERITVAADAAHFAGQSVKGPLAAFAQAEVIKKHANEIGGGKTYAELAKDDPKRQTVMTASFLRASLFTSVVAFGVAALVMGLGLLFILVGAAIVALADRQPTAPSVDSGAAAVGV
ncbi:MAG: aromatic ring-opening dioxygenase LigA [Actinomycetota bacterium]